MFRTTIQSKDVDSIDLYEVSLTKFRRGKYQSRSLKKQKEAHELAESIWELREKFPKTLGIKDPILCRMVTDTEDGCSLVSEEHYEDDDAIQDMLAESDTRLEIIDGHCRLEAISILAERDPAYNKIKVRIEYAEDPDAWLWGFIANKKRTDLDPIEEAISFSMALEDKTAGYTQQTLCAKAGIKRSYLAERLALLKLPEDAQEMIADDIISVKHGVTLNSVNGIEGAMDLLTQLIQYEVTQYGKASSTAELRQLVNRINVGDMFAVAQGSIDAQLQTDESLPTIPQLNQHMNEHIMATMPVLDEVSGPWPLTWFPVEDEHVGETATENEEAVFQRSCETCPLRVQFEKYGPTRCIDGYKGECYPLRQELWAKKQAVLLDNETDVDENSPSTEPEDEAQPTLLELIHAWLEKEESTLSRRYTLARSLKDATSGQPQWNLLKAYCETNNPDCQFDPYILSALQMAVDEIAELLGPLQDEKGNSDQNDGEQQTNGVGEDEIIEENNPDTDIEFLQGQFDAVFDHLTGLFQTRNASLGQIELIWIPGSVYQIVAKHEDKRDDLYISGVTPSRAYLDAVALTRTGNSGSCRAN